MNLLEAKKILNIDEDFDKSDILKVYKHEVEMVKQKYDGKMEDVESLFEKLYNIISAYHLIEDTIDEANNLEVPPLIIFTDASLRDDMETATFGIVVRDLGNDFEVPIKILEKYQIKFHNSDFNHLCVISGEIVNFDVHATEMMGVVAGLEIFSYSLKSAKRQIVFYTDSLVTKKVLSAKRLPPNTKNYAEIRKYFMKLILDRSLDVVIKKVKAHAGVELNEVADQVAKDRLYKGY